MMHNAFIKTNSHDWGYKSIELKSYAMQTLTKNWLNPQTSDTSLTSWRQPFCNAISHGNQDGGDVTSCCAVTTSWHCRKQWLEFGLFSTITAIIRACACWALFVVTLTNTVHLIKCMYIYIYIYMMVALMHQWQSQWCWKVARYCS